MDHNYDGIQELDNPLPNWWLITFFGTIFFAFIYYIHYEFASGPSLDQELQTSLAKIESLQSKHGKPSLGADELKALMSNPKAMSEGHEIFTGKCAVCHGQELQGMIGPNLTDEYWLHGQGHVEEIYQIVETGVVDKGMPAWKGLLTQNDLAKVAAFVATKIGSNPSQPKNPEGEKVTQ